MKTRIILGAIMLTVLAGVLALDWFLEHAHVIQVARGDGAAVVLRGLPVAIVLMLIAPRRYGR
ncbi:MAG: hypothetical protein H8E53_02645, partial [Planctomycetes bacterium]|nr:hypothetical protein [Planctomycetota bacterium]